MLLIPPLAPAGGVLLAVSSIINAGTWIVQNRHRIAQGLNAVGGAIKNAATAVGAVARRAAEKVGQAASKVASTVGNAITGVKSFFGNLFSGKG
jgi:phage-related protein